MPLTVFISRQLTPDSVFHKKLSAAGFEVFGQSLIKFAPVPFDSPAEMDWFFFYSQNGVRFFFENSPTKIFPGVKIATIGPATAEVVKSFGHSVHFIGDGDSKTTSSAFLKMAAGQKVAFPRALNSRRSIQNILQEKIDVIDLVVYENRPKKEVESPDCQVLVFTSPMNAQAYFSVKKWREGQRVIAIGETTAGAVRDLGIENVEVAREASEEGLVAAVLSIKNGMESAT